ncbi:bifunctional 2-polyprenyl-6-hydroxyphenol methylase/3-demethylubiquinol 3-O-methyltransferase UbiG [Herbaspirillum sp. SJZ099]|uniref:class I SAM-dependent methyltransferase n=1 Tax=Herbaspirillum sp. SJZ099 TaxID=2572916 RepID=UPI0011A2FD9B|nr:class I SAM-dependent methyltransferase [Herbaspirillum sp. SJZ099]TWC65058.1 methyltransferase family protein [Herbaspirillum sp. SJZ099]
MSANSWDYYQTNPEEHFRRFESLRFEDVHFDLVRYLPSEGGLCLDVGAGSGRDAAAIAKRGIHVLAVEPNGALLKLASMLHNVRNIEWERDSLPFLKKVKLRDELYDFILLSAVWMHLRPSERDSSLQTLWNLLQPGGYLAISLRIAKPDEARAMFDVSVEDLTARAVGIGFSIAHIGRVKKDSFNRSDVRWSKVILSKGK